MSGSREKIQELFPAPFQQILALTVEARPEIHDGPSRGSHLNEFSAGWVALILEQKTIFPGGCSTVLAGVIGMWRDADFLRL
jgi:hypothetical protein